MNDYQITRYCRPSTIHDNKILHTAFMLREFKDGTYERCLSFYSLKDLEGEILDKLNIVYQKQLKARFNLSNNGIYSVLQVSQIESRLKEWDCKVIEDGNPEFIPLHVGIYYKYSDMILIAYQLSKLANETKKNYFIQEVIK